MIFETLHKLDEQDERGDVPEPEELSGDYRIVVPWFPWLSLAMLKHRKAVGHVGVGDNVLAGGFRFGHFRLKKEAGWLLIDYDLAENPGVMRRVVDRVRRLPDGRLVGKLFYRLPGREQFLMFFEMRSGP